EDLAPAWRRRETPVFAPRRFLDAEDRAAADPLPHRWDVTSDSIAARLAVRLGAVRLVLLKSTAAPPGLDRPGAAALGLVDPPFPHRWAVPSDSIAARLAVRLGAVRLVLLKSTAAPPGLDRPGAAALGLVDPTFPAASRPIPRVTLVNLRSPGAVEAVLR